MSAPDTYTYKIAIVGATGAVGRKMLCVLEARRFPVGEVMALASHRSAGAEIPFAGRALKVRDLADYDFAGVDIALFSAGGEVSARHAPRAVAAGAVVIDNSSHFRMDPDVPLVVPEVNADALALYTKRRIVANPNCSTAQLVVALKPLHDRARIRRVVVATYQSVSGAGAAAMAELERDTQALLKGDDVSSQSIAFNALPRIDALRDDGATKEEWKMAVETQKILNADIALTATCVRVPVFVGHAEAVNIAFETPLRVDDARALLADAPGCCVCDMSTPRDCAGRDAVCISRIRADATIENGLNMWIVADNLLKGAALNAVQIAERLVRGREGRNPPLA